MNKKSAAVLIIFVIVLIFGGVSVYYYRNFVLQNSGSEQNKKTEEITVEDKKISENEKPLKIEATYPHITDMDDFNKKAESMINGWIQEFKKNSLENDAAVKKIDPESYAKYPRQYDFLASYEKGRADKNIISIIFTVYTFEGGAHGATNFYPLNYSIKDKKEIKLADLFLNQPDYIQKISAYCIAALTKQIIEKMQSTEGSWINEGAGPKEENFSIFLINPSASSGQATLTFYFPQYQTAPYSYGEFKVTMPR